MSENQTIPTDFSFPTNACCSQAEALVIIEAVPLCCVDPLGAAALEASALACAMLPSKSEGFDAGLPARSATIMPCAQALSLVEGTGHVVF